MKKTIIITVLLFVGTFLNVNAQDENFKQDALKLTMLSSSAVDASLEQLYVMIPEDKVAAFKKELKPIMDNYMVKMSEKTMKYYTHEEVKGLLKFYKTELGKKNLDVQAKMMTDVMASAQELNTQLMPVLQKYMGGQ